MSMSYVEPGLAKVPDFILIETILQASDLPKSNVVAVAVA